MFEIVLRRGAAARDLPDGDGQREDDRDVAQVLVAVRAHPDPNSSPRGRTPARARPRANGEASGSGTGSERADRRLDRLGREAVADPEVGVDVAPARARRARAWSAACGRRRRPSGRRGPSRSPTRAGRSPRAAAPGPRPRPSSWISSYSRRVSSTETPATNAWNWSARISTSPITTGPFSTRTSARLRRRTTASMRAISSSGMTGLGDPVVGAEPQPAHALGDGGLPGADDHAEPGQPRAELVQVRPALGTQHRQIDHDRVQAQARPSRPAARERRARDAASPSPPAACPAPAGNRCRNRSPPGGRCRLTRGAGAPLINHHRRHLAAETTHERALVRPAKRSGNDMFTGRKPDRRKTLVKRARRPRTPGTRP